MVLSCEASQLSGPCTEIAATMSDADVLFTAKTLTAALQMQQTKQQVDAATRPVVQELAAQGRRG